MRKLSELKIGETGIIQSFESEDISIKLMELGCMPGEHVEVQNVALTGDPISIYVSGYNLSLRLEEAAQIRIKKTHITDNQ
jgi:ferrous iron transport protein A